MQGSIEIGDASSILLRCPKFVARYRSQNFDRCHSLRLAFSATGSARRRPHLSTSPYIELQRIIL